MTLRSTALQGLLLCTLNFTSGCGDRHEEVSLGRFDPKTIAAEADKGNLAPLAELNEACTKEVEKQGKRAATCALQDEVGRLTKTLAIRF